MDFVRLQTPPQHGDTLVEPPAGQLAQLAVSNHAQLGALDFRILDVSASETRQMVRRRLGLQDDRVAVVTGHQPEFIHPGVWAKHVVVSRLADALAGAALDLVVDSDAPRAAALHVPTVRAGRLTVMDVPCAAVPPGSAWEQVERLDAAQLTRLEQTLRSMLGDRFERSMMPLYLEGLRGRTTADDWVDQATSGRHAVEQSLGITVDDVRVSRVWGGPLLAEMMLRAGDFAIAYNRALADYRRRYRLRSAQRPIPDLLIEPDRVEVPAWVYRRGEVRRRLFVRSGTDHIEVFADRERRGVLERALLGRCATASEALASLEGLRFRPRALALTLWARLFLADLFIHGIGGAKYDRITDQIIREYFGVTPPAMACVSATMRLDLPRHPVTVADLREARQRLRDLRYNPQRYVPENDPTAELLRKRERAVVWSDSLRAEGSGDPGERRRAFLAIRELNDRILARHPGVAERFRRKVEQQEEQVLENAVADRRDYFFALFSRPALETLLERLPARKEFAI